MKLMTRLTVWNSWRKRYDKSIIYKLLVLFGFRRSIMFDMELILYEANKLFEFKQ